VDCICLHRAGSRSVRACYAAGIETVSRKPASRLGSAMIVSTSASAPRACRIALNVGCGPPRLWADWLASAAARSTGVARLNACDGFPLFVLSVDRSRAALKALASLR